MLTKHFLHICNIIFLPCCCFMPWLSLWVTRIMIYLVYIFLIFLSCYIHRFKNMCHEWIWCCFWVLCPGKSFLMFWCTHKRFLGIGWKLVFWGGSFVSILFCIIVLILTISELMWATIKIIYYLWIVFVWTILAHFIFVPIVFIISTIVK